MLVNKAGRAQLRLELARRRLGVLCHAQLTVKGFEKTPLVVVVSLEARIVDAADVDDNVEGAKHLQITRANYLGGGVMWALLGRARG